MIGAADGAAQALGLRPGLPLAQAQAMRPGLIVIDADPAGDAAALRDLAAWCQRYAPLTAADPPGGIRIDSTGADHLHGGEAAMLGDLLDRLARSGFTARAAVADTPGAAWALARHGDRPLTVVPPGAAVAALAPLPVAALRLPAETVAALDRLGFARIGQLAAAPRGPLVRRFGAGLMRQLDFAQGAAFEPLEPVPPRTLIRQRLDFAEPLMTAEAFATVIDRLCRAVCTALERRGEGARRLDLVCERVDGTMQLVAVGTARPVRDAVHLARLLAERIETTDQGLGDQGLGDPGLGVEAMTLWVPLAEAMTAGQGDVLAQGGGAADLGPLIDRLVARFGTAQVYRAAPVESDVPERSVARVAGLSGNGKKLAAGFAAAPAAADAAAAGAGDGAAAGSAAGRLHLAAYAASGAPGRWAGAHLRRMVAAGRGDARGARLLGSGGRGGRPVLALSQRGRRGAGNRQPRLVRPWDFLMADAAGSSGCHDLRQQRLDIRFGQEQIVQGEGAECEQAGIAHTLRLGV